MSGIGHQQKASNSQFLCASLMDLIGAEIYDVVLLGTWSTWEKRLEFPW